MTIQMHKKVKITVLRTEYYQELAEQYAIPNLGKCPFHQKRSSAVQRWHQSAGWDVWRCLAGDCSHGASVILGGTGSAVWHLAQ